MREKKVAFITGAGGNMGRKFALDLAKQGIDLALCDINEENINSLLEQVRALGVTAYGYVADISDAELAEKSIKDAANDLGGLDILIHAAGGSARKEKTYLIQQSVEVIDKMIKINLMSALYINRAAAQVMVAQGTGGRIINISSATGINGSRRNVEYSASKGGVMSLTKALCKELGEYKITVNCVSPGLVQRPEQEFVEKNVYGSNYLNEMCTADDISAAVCFLASEEAHFITGQIIQVDGGRTLSMKGSD